MIHDEFMTRYPQHSRAQPELYFFFLDCCLDVKMKIFFKKTIKSIDLVDIL